MSYELDAGLILAAERFAGASHGVASLLATYKWWADFANRNPNIKEAKISADHKANNLRRALIQNGRDA